MNNQINMPNQYGGGKQTPTRIFIHAMGEFIHTTSEDYFAADFLRDVVNYSAHYLVTPSAITIKCRDESQIGYHATPYNTNSIGIEILVPGLHDLASLYKAMEEEWCNERQFIKTTRLVKSICQRWNIEKIDRHSDVNAKKQDPGIGFPWERFKEITGF